MRHLPSIKLHPILEDASAEGFEVPFSGPARDVCKAIAEMYGRVGFVPPWIAYLAVDEGGCVGTCSFKSAPQARSVEIAYFTFPEFENQGYATAMASQLIEITRAQSPETEVCAHTLPQKNASAALLARLGFRMTGEVDHPEDGRVWKWILPAS